MKKQFGFTLSEILLAIGILGVIVAMVTPAIVKVSPSATKMMVRQTYYTTTTTVSELINNPFFYKRINDSTGTIYEGFDDTTSITYRGKTYSDKSKFVDLFTNYLNVKGSIVTTTTTCRKYFADVNTCRVVNTTNGQKWIFAVPSDTGQVTTRILIDTNGDKGPNCRVGCTEDICTDPDVVYDQFRIVVYNNGTVLIDNTDAWAVETVKSTGTLVD